MDKSNTVKDGDDSQKKLLHFFSPSSLEGWLTKVSTQVRKTRVRYATNAKHHNFIPFIFQQTFPGNRHARATTVNYTILWFLKRRRPDPQTCVISQVSHAWESIKKRKSRGWNRLGDGYQAAPDCWGRRCSTVRELHPTAVAWQTCCVGTKDRNGRDSGGQPHDKGLHCQHIKSG